MKIKVIGFDPSLRNWGIAESWLDLTTGYLDTPLLSLIETTETKGKQVRQNSHDLHAAEQLAAMAIPAAKRAKAIFVEVPVGSQSARSMASYGVCVGVLGAIRSLGIPLIEVTATEVKLSLTNEKTATKAQMIKAALTLYPQANFPTHRGNISNKAEHVADAIGAIHAGVNTSAFQNLMRLYAQV